MSIGQGLKSFKDDEAPESRRSRWTCTSVRRASTRSSSSGRTPGWSSPCGSFRRSPRLPRLPLAPKEKKPAPVVARRSKTAERPDGGSGPAGAWAAMGEGERRRLPLAPRPSTPGARSNLAGEFVRDPERIDNRARRVGGDAGGAGSRTRASFDGLQEAAFDTGGAGSRTRANVSDETPDADGAGRPLGQRGAVEGKVATGYPTLAVLGGRGGRGSVFRAFDPVEVRYDETRSPISGQASPRRRPGRRQRAARAITRTAARQPQPKASPRRV